MEMTINSRWAVMMIMVLSGMSAAGCTHQVMMPTGNLWQATGQHEQKIPAVSVLRVHDAITNPDQQKDPKSLGQDVSHWGLLGFVPLRHDTNEYRSDRDRAQVVQEGIAAMLSDMGLAAAARPETAADQLRAVADGHLVLQTTLRSFHITNDLSLIITILANAGHLDKLQGHVVLECQLLQPGKPAPLWQGTVEGKTEWDAGEYGDADFEANVRWHQERSAVVRDAIADAVKNLVAQSGIKQIGIKLQSEERARTLATIQEREKSGDLQGTLSLYVEAFRSAMTGEQATAAVAGIARTVQKMPSKPALPEDARKFGVQATSLVEKQRYEEAVALYQKALEIAPWWAEGHFNRALVLATQHRFPEAIAGMKHFVVLAPESPDARAAQDKMYEWELEAPSQPVSSTGSSSAQAPNPEPRSAFGTAAKGGRVK
jgi:tetratricopeptide (TPR) repeat protein